MWLCIYKKKNEIGCLLQDIVMFIYLHYDTNFIIQPNLFILNTVINYITFIYCYGSIVNI